jgi:hypothetical protein
MRPSRRATDAPPYGGLYIGQPERARAALAAWEAQHPRPVATLAQVADHVEHIAKIAGIDHVGIGSDFDGIPDTPIGLEGVDRFPALLEELMRRGWSDRDIGKLAGENLLRVMAAAEKVGERLRAPPASTVASTTSATARSRSRNNERGDSRRGNGLTVARRGCNCSRRNVALCCGHAENEAAFMLAFACVAPCLAQPISPSEFGPSDSQPSAPKKEMMPTVAISPAKAGAPTANPSLPMERRSRRWCAA